MVRLCQTLKDIFTAVFTVNLTTTLLNINEQQIRSLLRLLTNFYLMEKSSFDNLVTLFTINNLLISMKIASILALY